MEKCKYRSRSNSMNVLFIKEKSKSPNYNAEEPRTTVALASGDCSVPRCRLCGCQTHLKSLTKDHCDEILRRLFEVTVPSNCMICESCVKCLKICERFKALVHASFEIMQMECRTNCDKITETLDRVCELPVTNPEKEIIELLKTRLKTEKPKRKREIKKKNIIDFKPDIIRKRANVACVKCQQKYPMLVTSDGYNYTCSRCKQIELKNIDGKKHVSSLITAKRDGSKINKTGKSRHSSQKHGQQHLTTTPFIKYSLYLPQHQCTLCPKKYSQAENLATHMKLQHEAPLVCKVCGKKNKNRESLDKHVQQHCDFPKHDHSNDQNKKVRVSRMPFFQDNILPITSALEINK